MNRNHTRLAACLARALCLTLPVALLAGCDRADSTSATSIAAHDDHAGHDHAGRDHAGHDQPAPATAAIGPAASPIEPTLDQGWCGGHGVPESVCTRCNPALTPTFKEAGDWCAEHDLPETQCTVCNPAVEAQWAKLNPANAAIGPAASPVEPTLDQGWCGGHGVPESVCTRCNPSLIPAFKETGDWCVEHDLPETQCTVCNPAVEAEWAKLNPANAGKTSDSSSPPRTVTASTADWQLDRVPRLLTGTSDPLCNIEAMQIRFVDATVPDKAGLETDTAAQRRMASTLELPAEIEFDAARVTRVSPRTPGIVRDVAASPGDMIAPGDLLAVLDSPALGEAKSRYIQRRQDADLAEADLRRVRTITEGVSQLLELCTPEKPPEQLREALAEFPVGEAKARLLRAHASLLLARAEADRQATLSAKNLTSERDVQAAQSSLAAAEAEFVALREEVAFTTERELLAAQRTEKTARTALEAAERELHILGLTPEQIEAVGEENHPSLVRYELRSPVAGRVIERKVASGESVDLGDVLFVVADLSKVWAVADAPERELVRLREGQPVLFTVDGIPGVSFDGRLNWISSEVDHGTRTVQVRADLPNDDGLLRAGMYGRARIILRGDEEVVSVPDSAVQTDGCCQLVFVQQSPTLYQPRKVLLGTGSNGYVEVLRGLDPGERVVTAGSFLLKTELLKSNIGAGCCEVDPGR